MNLWKRSQAIGVIIADRVGITIPNVPQEMPLVQTACIKQQRCYTYTRIKTKPIVIRLRLYAEAEMGETHENA